MDCFLAKLFPVASPYLPYPQAEERIFKSKLDADTKEQMHFLLQKTSRCTGLGTAAQKWKQTYNDVNARKFHSMIRKFYKLHINPIPFPSVERKSVLGLRALIRWE